MEKGILFCVWVLHSPKYIYILSLMLNMFKKAQQFNYMLSFNEYFKRGEIMKISEMSKIT